MNAMNVLPLQVTLAVTLAVVVIALWARSGGGARATLRAVVLRLDRITSGLTAIAACLALAVAVAAGAWQVIARFATETPSIWSEALVRMALIWMAYLGLALALRAIEAAALACSLSLMGIMFWFGWEMAYRVRFQELAGLEVSITWGYAAIPVGAVFAMVGAVAQFLDRRSEELEAAV